MRMKINGVIGDIDPLPGCSTIGVSHNVWLPANMRGQGLGKTAHRERISIAHDLGYDLLLATCDASNEAQMKIFLHNGWYQCCRFRSRKTGHIVVLWQKLTQDTVEG